MKIKVFGITGTNGKTTVSWMLRNVLKTRGKKCGLIGTIEYEAGKRIYKPINTTPGKDLLKELFSQMEEEETEYCVMEVSSHGIAQNRIADIDFDYGGFTNLTEDHLDYHKSMEEYYKTKKALFYKCRKAVVINWDDDYGKRLYGELLEDFFERDVPQPKILRFSLENERADVFGIIREENLFGSRVEVIDNRVCGVRPKGNSLGTITVPMGGRHFASDCLMAVALALEEKISFEHIRKGIETLPKIPGRSEILDGSRDIIVIIDYAHTPDALENLLKTACKDKKGKLICVFGCGGDRDKDKRYIMGRIAGTYADYCIVTNDNPRTEAPEDIAAAVEEGVYSTGCNYAVILNRYDAIRRAVFLSTKWDIIVIAGKGHEKYQIIGNKKFYFDDRQTAEELLEKK